ncbi:MAG: hypothetical protein A3D65_00085 [Candidatus Lloydbacteria bacterium RIFCSPHIGHO2_02_FULL_50_13]|uniref:Uncharacterized protein n=1 Tax=Candidatus Lloydbacteria bacterium RIFCSPHIGHO2_02_FULL_50_13 TaxID=1798661 RepID=A0A1G2DAI6_9BACT|nr:MAG: hypothetical protein A3D65_00085 [Candidatus Lloydbacteria bacterium RIFCSPHIGHO2_02_FULL_50_13]
MPRTISPVKPWLIQRCKLEDGKFSYDYMVSSEFECGDQAKALKTLFKGKVALAETSVQANEVAPRCRSTSSCKKALM